MSKRLSPYKWRKRKKECFERDEYMCQEKGSFCHAGTLDAHHIVHRSKGGSDELENLITLCRWHHERRHPEKQVRWTKGIDAAYADRKAEAHKEFEKIYPTGENK